MPIWGYITYFQKQLTRYLLRSYLLIGLSSYPLYLLCLIVPPTECPYCSQDKSSEALSAEKIKELIPVYERARDRHTKDSYPYQALQFHINELKARAKNNDEK